MIPFLFTLHSHNRWLVIGMAVVAIIKFFLVWEEHLEFGRATRIIYGIFTGFLGIQILLGLIILFNMGITPYRLEHAAIMIAAFALAHFPFRWKALSGELRAKRSMFVILGVLALVILGIWRLPQGFTPTAATKNAPMVTPQTAPQ